jgi:hypothetical protein
MRMADEVGFTVCDLIIKIRNGPMVSTKWKEAHHARKRHCYWIVCATGITANDRLVLSQREKLVPAANPIRSRAAHSRHLAAKAARVPFWLIVSH